MNKTHIEHAKLSDQEMEECSAEALAVLMRAVRRKRGNTIDLVRCAGALCGAVASAASFGDATIAEVALEASFKIAKIEYTRVEIARNGRTGSDS